MQVMTEDATAEESGTGSVLAPAVINASVVSFNAGISSGLTRSNIPISIATPIAIGDIMFLTFFEVLAGNAHPITGVTDDSGGSNVWTELFPRMTYSSGAYAYQVFWAKALAPISGPGSFNVTLTLAVTSSNADINGDFLSIRGISALDQVSSGVITGDATPTGASITTSQNACVLSFINASGGHCSISSPFFDQVGTGQPTGAIAIYFSGTDFIAAPGTYGPTWTDAGGTLDAAIANVSFT
jgi:hypothetical protein